MLSKDELIAFIMERERSATKPPVDEPDEPDNQPRSMAEITREIRSPAMD